MDRKKFLASCSIAVIASMGCNSMAFADSYVEKIANVSQQTSESFIQSYYIVLTDTGNFLQAVGNKLIFEANTSVQTGYTAKITIELQQYDGGWDTIKTWTATESEFAFLDKNWYVDSGFSYRLKLTHQGLNQTGNIIETFTDYSDSIYVD